jgi:hypothetical protein
MPLWSSHAGVRVGPVATLVLYHSRLGACRPSKRCQLARLSHRDHVAAWAISRLSPFASTVGRADSTASTFGAASGGQAIGYGAVQLRLAAV